MYSWTMLLMKQIDVPEAQLEHELNFLKENMEVSILMFGDEILGIDLPTTVELEVTETEPGVKGDTAQGATKSSYSLKQVILYKSLYLLKKVMY